MNLLRRNWDAVFAFIHRERLYFLILILALSVIALHQNLYSTFSNIEVSSEVEKMKQFSDDFEKSLQSQAGLLKIFEAHPLAAVVFVLFISVFAGLFIGGLALLLLVGIIPRMMKWFEGASPQQMPFFCNPVVLFRVGVLVFASMTVSSFVIENFWDGQPESENFIGLFHTLVIDGLACFSIYAVLTSDKIKWGDFLWPAQTRWVKEVKRGIAAYVGVFPIFALSLFSAIIISNLLRYEPPLHPLVKIFVEEEQRSQLVFQFAILLAAVLAPIMEELFFRGFCYPVFRGWWGAQAAAGVSAAFFAGIHGSGFAFFPIFILGLALAWLYEKRGGVTACWIFHIFHNMLFTGYFFTIKTLLGISS